MISALGLGGEAKLEDLSGIGLASRGGDLLGINNVCWFVVNKNFAEKIWGKKDEDLDKLSFEVQKTGGDDGKRWIVGISGGEKEDSKMSCVISGIKWTIKSGKENWNIENWENSKNSKNLSAIFWKPVRGKNLPVLKSGTLNPADFVNSTTATPKNILFCFGGESWKERWETNWDNKPISSQAKKTGDTIECGNPNRNSKQITEADGKKFNELAEQ